MKSKVLLFVLMILMMSIGNARSQTVDATERVIIHEQVNGSVTTSVAPINSIANQNTEAVTVQAPPFNGTSGLNRGPNGSTRFQITLAFYSSAELQAAGFFNGGSFNSLGFVYAAAAAGVNQVEVDSANLKIYLLNSTDASGASFTTNWATATTGASVVYDGPITLPAYNNTQNTPFDVNFTTPFVYTGGSVYVMYEYTNPTASISLGSAIYQCNSTTTPAGLITRNAVSTSALPTTLGGTSTFRPSLRWGYTGPAVPDAEVLGLYPYGYTSRLHSNNPITALVRNNGGIDLTYTATLTVRDSATGTVKFTDNTTYAGIVATGGRIDTLVFNNWNPTVDASDSIFISVNVTSGTDPNLANNSASTKQIVSADRVSHRQNVASTLGVGSATTTADIAAKFTTNGTKVVKSLSSLFTSTGQSITFGIWAATSNGTPGAKLWTSSPLVTNTGVLSVTVPNITVNGTFFVGATQTSTTNFGIGYQEEPSLRPNTFFIASPTNGAFSALNPPFRISIDAVIDAPPPPVTLGAFSLVSPPNNVTVVTSPSNTSPINISWRRSAAGAQYKWLYWIGTATGAPTLVVPSGDSGFDTTLTLANNAVDGILASLGLDRGDSAVGQWRVFAYNSNNDSLGSTETRNIILKRAPLGSFAILYDSTSALNRVSRDTLASYLTSVGATFEFINRGGTTSALPIPALTPFQTVYLLGEGTSTASANTREAIRNYLNSGTIGNKARLIVFAEDIGWQHDRSATAAANLDTVLTRSLLGLIYLADNPPGGGNQRIFNTGTSLPDSIAGAFPDVFGIVPGSGAIPLYRFAAYSPTSDSVSSVGRNTSTYTTAVFGFDLRRYRSAFDSPLENVGAALTRVLQAATVYVQTGVPLPVEFTTFTAQSANGAVQLSWTTASELNNAGFEVERRSKGGSWNTLGFVEGRGTTTEANSYSFVDRSATGEVQYRLKQIDFDGRFEYSTIVEFNAGLPKQFELSQNYPNPFNPTTNIQYQLPTATKVNLKIFDVLGREVMVLVNGEQNAGTYNLQLNAANLSSGVYFYRLQAGNFTQTKKMLLVK